jgi:transposase InsO family protein
MSASSLRHQPKPDRHEALRRRIVDLAQRHRRYGGGMIHLKRRQAGEVVNYRRVERLYGIETLHIRRRRKKVPVWERQPLVRPGPANEMWSADVVFDRVASGSTLKCLVTVDDATHEAVAVAQEHAISGEYLTRIFDQICVLRGRPRLIRSDNGKAITGKAMLTWTHRHGVALRLIEPGTPNQNAYVESCHGRLRDECLHEHWFTSLAHATAVIDTWRREYNEERPTRSLGGLTPAQSAQQLVIRAVTMPDDSKALRY